MILLKITRNLAHWNVAYSVSDEGSAESIVSNTTMDSADPIIHTVGEGKANRLIITQGIVGNILIRLGPVGSGNICCVFLVSTNLP